MSDTPRQPLREISPAARAAFQKRLGVDADNLPLNLTAAERSVAMANQAPAPVEAVVASTALAKPLPWWEDFDNDGVPDVKQGWFWRKAWGLLVLAAKLLPAHTMVARSVGFAESKRQEFGL